MKILVVGDGHSAIHEAAVANAFRKLGHEVETFYWVSYFRSLSILVHFWLKIQNRLILGPSLFRLNIDVLQLVRRFNPDLVFIYRGTHIFAETICAIKRSVPSCTVCGYNNDDPFGPDHSRLLWRHFLASTPYYDLMFAYRHHNLIDFNLMGAKRVELLRSWFIPEINHPVFLDGQDSAFFQSDVVFIGHYENDGRLQLLEEIARHGFNVKIFGPPYEWNHLVQQSEELKHLSPVRLVWGDEYNKALCGSKIALCFFSKLNRDTYTRRCFEIPASGTMMISEYSDDLASIYDEGVDADFFRSKDELITKVTRYINDDALRRQVAANGRSRVVNDGHDVVSRMAKVLESVNTLKADTGN